MNRRAVIIRFFLEELLGFDAQNPTK